MLAGIQMSGWWMLCDVECCALLFRSSGDTAVSAGVQFACCCFGVAARSACGCTVTWRERMQRWEVGSTVWVVYAGVADVWCGCTL
jgi:hypothetical protein